MRAPFGPPAAGAATLSRGGSTDGCAGESRPELAEGWPAAARRAFDGLRACGLRNSLPITVFSESSDSSQVMYPYPYWSVGGSDDVKLSYMYSYTSDKYRIETRQLVDISRLTKS